MQGSMLSLKKYLTKKLAIFNQDIAIYTQKIIITKPPK
jgi:hypothetical protein